MGDKNTAQSDAQNRTHSESPLQLLKTQLLFFLVLERFTEGNLRQEELIWVRGVTIQFGAHLALQSKPTIGFCIPRIPEGTL